MEKQFISTTEAANLLGISRVSVFKRINKGDIKAKKVGRNFIIAKEDLEIHEKKKLGARDEREIDQAVKKTMREYGETIKLLGNA